MPKADFARGSPHLAITDGGNGESYAPSISADGRYVTFYSRASNFTGTPDANGQLPDIFVYDAVTHSTTYITHGGNGESSEPSISADRSSVVFATQSSNLEEGVTHPYDGYYDIALWHI